MMSHISPLVCVISGDSQILFPVNERDHERGAKLQEGKKMRKCFRAVFEVSINEISAIQSSITCHRPDPTSKQQNNELRGWR